MSLYNIKMINGKRVIEWNKGRKRGLEDAKERIGNIEIEIKNILKIKKRARILEVGCGYGKALLEIKKKFGDSVETYGINFEKRWNNRLIKKFAIANMIFNNKTIDENLPKLYIGDAG